jgi:transposase-like protein
VKNLGGESADAWRSMLDGLVGRGLRRGDLVMSTAASRWHDLEMLPLRHDQRMLVERKL